MAEIKDLQSIIDKRAESKLKTDIRALTDVILKSGLTDELKVFLPNRSKPESGEYTEHRYNNLFQYDHLLYNTIFDNNIQKYREKETLAFVNKVDEIKEQVDELYEITSNLENR